MTVEGGWQSRVVRDPTLVGPSPWQDAVDGAAGVHRSPFPPIADYGFLSDSEVNALVAPGGSVEWLCVPRPDSPSVFAALLDRAGGAFRLGPADVAMPAGRRYVPGTLVLETTWRTRTGWAIVVDALCVGAWFERVRRPESYRRSPSDAAARHVLVRTVECVTGSVDLVLACEPRFEYGREEASWQYAGPGYGQAVAARPGSDLELRLVTDLRLGLEGGGAHAYTTLRENERAFAALTWSGHSPPASGDEALEWIEETADFWRGWLNRGDFPDHRWTSFLERSALTLKGLTYAPTGALLAAATTSLPETPGGERNWDYRYSWIRDSAFALWALYTLGFDREASDFFSFAADVASDETDLQVMYGIRGETELEEHVLDHLGGYEGARPVRIGNAAHEQNQHDVWGALIDAVYLHTKSGDQVSERVWAALEHHVACAIARWREPDYGIWEVRGPPRHFTSSKLMCWVALDRGARLARLRNDESTAERWEAIAREIHADICEHGVDERGVFVQHYETTALDASLLLLPLVRFLPRSDRRTRATVLAIADELSVDGLVLRYRVDETDDGLTGEEGTFTICSFWLVSALVEIGEFRRARELCEKLLSYAGPLQLYAEEIDVNSGRHLGNFPQAFTHLALVNAVMHVIHAEASR